MAASGCWTLLRSATGEGIRDGQSVPVSLKGVQEDPLGRSDQSSVDRATLANSTGDRARRFSRTIPYLMFVFVGANSLLNWTFVVQTVPFIAKSFLDGADWNNTVLGSFQAVEVLVQVILIRFGSTSVTVVVVAGLVNAVAGFLIPPLTLYTCRGARVWMLHLLCLVLGCCSGIFQGSGLAIASILPEDFVSSVSTGKKARPFGARGVWIGGTADTDVLGDRVRWLAVRRRCRRRCCRGVSWSLLLQTRFTTVRRAEAGGFFK